MLMKKTTDSSTKHSVTSVTINKIKRFKKVLAFVYAFAFFLSISVVPGFCGEETAAGFKLNFQPAEMFKWAQMILDMMMPVLYITLGISLAFIIVRALKSAFGAY